MSDAVAKELAPIRAIIERLREQDSPLADELKAATDDLERSMRFVSDVFVNRTAVETQPLTRFG